MNAAMKMQIPEDQRIRLNKFLADAGIASRRKADALIARGVVKVNGRVVTELGTKVHPSDLVTVEGKPGFALQAPDVHCAQQTQGLHHHHAG